MDMKMPNNVILNSNILPQTHASLSTFDLSEGLKTTMNFDNLYPVWWEELNPGDHFEMSVRSLGRLAPTVAPIMDNIKLKYFAFYVPNRLLWKNWKAFFGERIYPGDKKTYTVPQISMNTPENVSGGLADYLGIPPMQFKSGYPCNVTALPFRAYNKIWNDWFKANQLQNPVIENVEDSGDQYTKEYYKILKKGKPLDYFTSCLPYPQAGEPVTIPLTGNAPVNTFAEKVRLNGRNTTTGKVGTFELSVGADETGRQLYASNWQEVADHQFTEMYADMSHITGVTINNLRTAVAIEKLLENDALSGERYIDLVNKHFGTTVPDFMAGRSQFIGSCTSSVVVNPIVQTSNTVENSPQGNLTGIGVSMEDDDLFDFSAIEHGIVMVLACVEGQYGYQQGISRKFDKLIRYDYMFPEFWNLGEQVVKNREIYLSDDNSGLNDLPFGYQERFREEREGISKVSGKMRTSAPGSLDVYHLTQFFNNLPKLNSEFIESDTPIERCLAVPDEEQFILDIWFDIKATRPLPVSANPSLLAGRI